MKINKKLLENYIFSLIKFLLNKKINIFPVPKIKLITQDTENANNILGKTAYYDGKKKTITLFCLNRHPKDILRSLAHELIHHKQNLENRIPKITTDNISEDDVLYELEKEAYTDGNMLFREWETEYKSKYK